MGYKFKLDCPGILENGHRQKSKGGGRMNNRQTLRSASTSNTSNNSIADLFSEIKTLIEDDDLAAVIVHMNDTYRIEEKRGEGLTFVCPGFARVAALTDKIRTFVLDQTARDRTVVLHSGDFLSPSFMSNKLRLNGEQIIDLMNCCGVNFATIGNHEFDLDAHGHASILGDRLGEANFTPVATNLLPGRMLAKESNFSRFRRIVYWPEDKPFMAILAFAGKDTQDDAAQHGFKTLAWQSALSEAIGEISEDARISCIVALSHMTREEDVKLQAQLNEEWMDYGYAYVLGGHDHDIHWREVRGRCSLSKNDLNLRSVTVALLTKKHMAIPRSHWGSTLHSRVIVTDETNLAEIAELAVQTYRHAATHRSGDLVEAYCRKLRSMIKKDSFGAERGFASNLWDWTISYLDSTFRLGHLWSEDYLKEMQENRLFWLLDSNQLGQLDPNAEADKRISFWLQVRDKRAGDAGNKIVAKFDKGLCGEDKFLRSESTNFGNFVADSIMAATKTDLAILHAGLFRSDETIVGELLVSDLQEAFVFDEEDAVTVVELDQDEVKAIYEHARGKVNEGGFLQVSRSESWVRKQSLKRLKVAMPTYLLIDNKDGYQELLSAKRGCGKEALLANLTVSDSDNHSVIELVILGATAPSVIYNEEIRLSATLNESLEEQFVRGFIAVCKDYEKACKKAKLDIHDKRLILELYYHGVPDANKLVSKRDIGDEKHLLDARERVVACAFWGWQNLGGMRGLHKMVERLSKGRERHEENLPLSDYLSDACCPVYEWLMAQIAKKEREK